MVLELHGRLLRLVCERADRDFEGLAAAERWVARQGCKDKHALRKLGQLDVATAWEWHVSVPKGDAPASSSAVLMDQRGFSAAAGSGGNPQVRNLLHEVDVMYFDVFEGGQMEQVQVPTATK